MSAAAITGSGVLAAAAVGTPAVAQLLAGERLRALNDETRLLLAAARLALRRAALGERQLDPGALGIAVATGCAGHEDYVALFLAAHDPARPPVPLARGPQTGMNAPAAIVSIKLGAGGPNATLANGAVGGLDALRYALDALATGRAAAMLVGAVEIPPVAQPGAPPGGAAAFVLETPSGGVDARVRARVTGVATAHAPGGDVERARERARRAALAHAGIEPDAVAERLDAVHDARESVAAVARLAHAAERLHRAEARGPLLVGVADTGGGAGAAVLVEAGWRAAA